MYREVGRVEITCLLESYQLGMAIRHNLFFVYYFTNAL